MAVSQHEVKTRNKATVVDPSRHCLGMYVCRDGRGAMLGPRMGAPSGQKEGKEEKEGVLRCTKPALCCDGELVHGSGQASPKASAERLGDFSGTLTGEEHHGCLAQAINNVKTKQPLSSRIFHARHKKATMKLNTRSMALPRASSLRKGRSYQSGVLHGDAHDSGT